MDWQQLYETVVRQKEWEEDGYPQSTLPETQDFDISDLPF